MACIKGDKMDNRVSSEEGNAVYHERQSRELCALHALNNLFQESKTFTKQNLDEICNSLAPESYINPHRSMIGLGNYDVNVLMAALQTKQLDTVWFDKRRDVNHLNIENIFGFILNIPTDLRLGILRLPIQRKHWIAVRQVGATFYNLDSKLDTPEPIGTDHELRLFLQDQVGSKEKELLLVVNPIVAQTGAWISDEVTDKNMVLNGSVGNVSPCARTCSMDAVQRFIDSDDDSERVIGETKTEPGN